MPDQEGEAGVPADNEESRAAVHEVVRAAMGIPAKWLTLKRLRRVMLFAVALLAVGAVPMIVVHFWGGLTYFAGAPALALVVGICARRSIELPNTGRVQPPIQRANLPAAVLAFEHAARRLEARQSASESLDAKIGLAFGVLGAGILAFTDKAHSLDQVWEKLLIGGLIATAALSLVDAMVGCVVGLRDRDVDYAVSASDFMNYMSLGDEQNSAERMRIAQYLGGEAPSRLTADDIKALELYSIHDKVARADAAYLVKRRLFFLFLAILMVLALTVLVIASPMKIHGDG
jgi:hypothetical protein